MDYNLFMINLILLAIVVGCGIYALYCIYDMWPRKGETLIPIWEYNDNYLKNEINNLEIRIKKLERLND